jgi:ABC-2 type transport system permease protein
MVLHMKQLIKYWAILQTSLINSLAYPGELIGRSLIMIPFMWIFYQLWKVTFAAGGVDTINGLTLRDTLWYLMLAETLELSKPFLTRTISDNVKDGSIAYLLNKPYSFLGYHLSNSLGETVFRGLVSALLGSLLVFWLVGPPPSITGFLIVIPAMIGAWVLNFCIAALIGLSAFVVEDVTAFAWIYQKAAFMLGGLMIPLDFYPLWLQTSARALPFSSMIYAPAKLFITPSPELFINTMFMQTVWIVVMGFLLTVVYRRGLTQLTVNGG